MVTQKICNQQGLLKTRLTYQEKQYPERATVIISTINHLVQIQQEIKQKKNISELMLSEAWAAKIYWKAFALLANQPKRWRRIHPHGPDPLNLALNIGYTILLNTIRKANLNHGLNPRIGFLHTSEQDKEALLYDFMELFRQTLIDRALLPLFSRNKKHTNISSKDAVQAVTRQINKPFVYQDNWLTGKEIINMEIHNYKQSIVNEDTWQPYRHSWSHAKKKKPRKFRG